MRRIVTLSVCAALLAVACGGGEQADDQGPQTIRLVTHDSFAISDGIIAAFEAETGHTVRLLTAGDAGTMVNQAVLSKDNPLADVMFGVDNTFLGRALDEGLFLEYESPLLSTVPDGLKLDRRVTPIDFGDVCINYDVAALAERGLTPPADLRALAGDAYADLVVVQHPGTSSPGLAFLMATVAEFGESGDYTWRDFWRELKGNGVLITSGWEDAYLGSFSGGSGAGDRPLVVSYATSPPAEVLFADPPVTEAPTAVIEAGCFRQIEFAGILAGSPVPNAARQLVDFMLSVPFQEDIPLNMFVFPANQDAEVPQEFIDYSVVPANPATLAPEVIDENRSRWIEEWVEVVTP